MTMVPEHLKRWPTGAARAALAARFGLALDPLSQDWEWEVADPARFGEFLDAYRTAGLDDDERFSLMEILVQCVEDMSASDVGGLSEWEVVADLLRSAPRLYAETVWYWMCPDETEPENCFRVSGPMRRLWPEIQRTISREGGDPGTPEL